MRLGTFCSGIGAPEVAARGMMRPVFFSEIEPFPSAVLAHHWPDVPNLGDMTAPDIVERIAALGLPDVIVAGTPCQAFSVAGLRQGTKDARGNLTLKFVEIVHAIVDARPDGRLAVVWENVPGVLSDKGNAFGAFLGGLVGAMAPVIPAEPPRKGGYKRFWNRSPKRRWRHRGRRKYRKPFWYPAWPSEGMVEGPRARAAWAVLDAQWAGVAQRRRRVFVVVDFGSCVDPAAILLEPDSLRGDSPPSREAGEVTAGGTLRGSDGGCDLDHARAGHLIPEVAWALQERDSKGADSDTKEGHLIPVAFDCKGTEVQFTTDGTHPTLRSMGHLASHQNAGGHAAVAFAIQERAVSENLENGPQGKGFQADVGYTLEARNKVQAVAFAQNQRGELRTSDISPQLTCGGGKPGEGYPAVAFDLRGREGGAMPEGPHDTANLRAASGGSSRSYIAHPWALRRLTPTECERLQGFPDGFTDVPHRGKPAADGPRYKALGNSMAVPVVRYILDRLRISWEAVN